MEVSKASVTLMCHEVTPGLFNRPDMQDTPTISVSQFGTQILDTILFWDRSRK